MDLIAGLQTVQLRFKSVTDKIMENSLQFICLHMHASKTLGHYWYSLTILSWVLALPPYRSRGDHLSEYRYERYPTVY